MLHSPLAGSVLECRCVVVGGALFLFMAVVARPFPVAGRAGLPVEMSLRHVLLLHEIGRMDARGVTGMTLGTCLGATHMAVGILAFRNSYPQGPTT